MTLEVCVLDQRKIWKTGKGTYVVSLPRDWAVKQIDKSSKVALFVSENRIVISTESEYKNPVGYIEMTTDDPVRLESQIVAAYVGGYSRLRLKIPEWMTKSQQKLREVQNRLYGTALFHESSVEFIMSMSVADNEIPHIIQRGFTLFHEIYKQTLELMERTVTSTSDLSAKRSEIIESIELDSDRTFLYGRRLLNKALLFPDVSEKIGLMDVRNAIEYSNIFSSFERLTDLQKEIFMLLMKINEKHLDDKNKTNHFLSSDGYSFKDYYEGAHEVVKTAFESMENEEKAYRVLSFKEQKNGSGLSYADPFITKENREKIYLLIKENESYSNFLLEIEGKVWAMVGIATNIAEAGRNLRRPTETEDISKFFV
jgi:phosphate uptake regulator